METFKSIVLLICLGTMLVISVILIVDIVVSIFAKDPKGDDYWAYKDGQPKE